MKRLMNLPDLLLTDSSPVAKYQRRKDQKKKALHWGQRKLLLSEIEFFSLYWNQQEIETPICVYAGAAEGLHINILVQLFPAIRFELYDPRRFAIKETNRVKIHREYFTNEIARSYAHRNDVFFISDIRTTNYNEILDQAMKEYGIVEKDESNDPIGPPDLVTKVKTRVTSLINEGVMNDMRKQAEWVKILNPVHALLKFRPRWPIMDQPDSHYDQYLAGDIYLQPWAPATSTETRLKPIRNSEGNYYEIQWDNIKYEGQCYYHNSVRRENYYPNIYCDDPELLDDYDSAAEGKILEIYLSQFSLPHNKIEDAVRKLSREITQSLNSFFHSNGLSLAQRRSQTRITSYKRAS
ncbi:Cap-specific mRNA (nucleoside-2-O-)-methyltransferase [uncultured virus]|nr:Cap-specific mRNA (nucleoside-2-O-)-methyltransferase [uncultured virus]